MEYTLIHMNENTWRIEDGDVRFFLLIGTEKALLIDSGMKLHIAKDIAAQLTNLPIELLNTHADRDHIGSNEQFDCFYMHPAEEPIYRHFRQTGRDRTDRRRRYPGSWPAQIEDHSFTRAYAGKRCCAGHEISCSDQWGSDSAKRAYLYVRLTSEYGAVRQ